jgi:hypothetical protein
VLLQDIAAPLSSNLHLVIPANAGIQTFNQRACEKSGFPRSRE